MHHLKLAGFFRSLYKLLSDSYFGLFHPSAAHYFYKISYCSVTFKFLALYSTTTTGLYMGLFITMIVLYIVLELECCARFTNHFPANITLIVILHALFAFLVGSVSKSKSKKISKSKRFSSSRINQKE